MKQMREITENRKTRLNKHDEKYVLRKKKVILTLQFHFALFCFSLGLPPGFGTNVSDSEFASVGLVERDRYFPNFSFCIMSNIYTILSGMVNHYSLRIVFFFFFYIIPFFFFSEKQEERESVFPFFLLLWRVADYARVIEGDWDNTRTAKVLMGKEDTRTATRTKSKRREREGTKKRMQKEYTIYYIYTFRIYIR